MLLMCILVGCDKSFIVVMLYLLKFWEVMVIGWLLENSCFVLLVIVFMCYFV